MVYLEYELAVAGSQTREAPTNRTICTTCKRPAPVSSTNVLGAHGPSGLRCPATGTTPTSIYEPASRPPAGSEPGDSERATYVFDRSRTIQRETADGRQESWTFPLEMTWAVPPWELRGITQHEYERRLREAARLVADQERAWSRERNARGGYSSGTGSSVHAVSGGLPGLGRRH